MEIIKIIGIALIGVIAIQILKNASSPLYAFISIAVGVILITISINSLSQVLVSFNEIINKTNISQELYLILLKIVGIGYLVDYSSSLCSDLGCESIGKKIEFAGKITIFLLAIPIIKNVILLIEKVL